MAIEFLEPRALIEDARENPKEWAKRCPQAYHGYLDAQSEIDKAFATLKIAGGMIITTLADLGNVRDQCTEAVCAAFVHGQNSIKETGEARAAVQFIRDIAKEELPHARIGTGAEVALRHILRKANETLPKV